MNSQKPVTACHVYFHWLSFKFAYLVSLPQNEECKSGTCSEIRFGIPRITKVAPTLFNLLKCLSDSHGSIEVPLILAGL